MWTSLRVKFQEYLVITRSLQYFEIYFQDLNQFSTENFGEKSHASSREMGKGIILKYTHSILFNKVCP